MDFIKENNVGSVYEGTIEKLVTAFKGLSLLEIETILSLAFRDDGTLSEDAPDLVLEQKRQHAI